MTEKYKAILNLPHPELRHPRMSMLNRAAQFASFDALEGYEEAVQEEARLTEPEKGIGEAEAEELDRMLRRLSEKKQPPVTALCFVPDERKAGGSFQTFTGRLKKVDLFNGQLILTDGTVLPLGRILKLDSPEEKDDE
ncbi:MAG: hypothetical protein MJ136_00525 [Clostridia bacterium]|nr:hypothetical protein [Clostridia bacterium]